MTPPVLALGTGDWLSLLVHFLMLSLLTVGGAIGTAPDMHRFLVQEKGWLTDPQFSASIAIAQGAPGPNMLFAGLMGWNVGLNAGGLAQATLGMALCLVGLLLPSSLLTYLTARWSHANRDLRIVRAFKQGLAPVVVGLVITTGWILAVGGSYDWRQWPLWAITLVSTVVVWRTKLHLLWMLAAGAAIGWFGWV